jgi:hypothetical protein
MWKIDPKDKHILKNKHDQIQTLMYNMFATWNYSMELGERGKRKENGRASVISKNIASVKVEDYRMCIESC